MKRIIASILLMVMVFTFAACGGETGKAEAPGDAANGETGGSVQLRLGHALSEGTPANDAIHQFCKDVEEKTEGRVSIKDFPNSQLGSETEMLEQVKIKSLESAAIMVGSMQSVDMKMAIEDLPYMWKTIENARAAYDGDFGKELEKIMAEHKFHGFGFVEWGFRHITNNKKPIVQPEDLKGTKIRVAQTKLRVDAFEQIGALPTVLAFSELYGALQQGVVDAQENPLANIHAGNFNEVQKYLSLTGHFYNTIMLVMHEDVWNQISPEDQETILSLSEELKLEVRKQNDLKEEDYINQLKSKGMEVNDDVDKEAFRDAMAPVYEKWENDVFGTELMDVYRQFSGWEE